jgi:hypothetical protein
VTGRGYLAEVARGKHPAGGAIRSVHIDAKIRAGSEAGEGKWLVADVRDYD